MPTVSFSDDDLLAYLEEMLPVERAAQIETSLRADADLRQRAALLIRRRDQGGHSVGEIWRRRRLSCPPRTQLGSWLLGVLDGEEGEYIEFHLQTVGCRLCAANVEDLRQSQAGAANDQQQRRQRYFESSAGELRSRKKD